MVLDEFSISWLINIIWEKGYVYFVWEFGGGFLDDLSF